MNILSRYLAGIASPKLIKSYLNDGASLVDVRTHVEFGEGSLPNAINIPLDSISIYTEELEKMRKVIVFCKSGMRSKMAIQFTKSHPNIDMINGGSLENIASLL